MKMVGAPQKQREAHADNTATTLQHHVVDFREPGNIAGRTTPRAQALNTKTNRQLHIWPPDPVAGWMVEGACCRERYHKRHGPDPMIRPVLVSEQPDLPHKARSGTDRMASRPCSLFQTLRWLMRGPSCERGVQSRGPVEPFWPLPQD
jgi:hypothetical protein